MELSFPKVLDSTMLATFASCPHKFFIEYICKRSPLEISPDLHAGKCFAAALEAARIAFHLDRESPEKALERAHRVFIAEWGNFEPPKGHIKTFEKMWEAVESYFDEYPLDSDHLRPIIRSDNCRPAVEFTFSIPLPFQHPESSDPLCYGGRFDMLAKDGPNIVVVDEKTTKYLYANWQKQFQMRGQLLGYIWAARIYGFHAVGAVIRGIGIQKTQIKHQELTLLYAGYEIGRWLDNMLTLVQQMLGYWEAMKEKEKWQDKFATWPYNYAEACAAYGGCPFIDLCTRSNEIEWLDNYAIREWDPVGSARSSSTSSQQNTIRQTGTI